MTQAEEMRGKRWSLKGLTEADMRLLYNGLKLQHGDFPETYEGASMWKIEVEHTMDKFPPEVRW
ncbi:MAG: hypothetical protein ABIG39_06715 [Candidatus Micrarchaeota archaeon]